MKNKDEVFRRKFQKAGIGKTDVLESILNAKGGAECYFNAVDVVHTHCCKCEKSIGFQTDYANCIFEGNSYCSTCLELTDTDDYSHHDYEDTSARIEVYDSKSLGEQMRFKLQLLTELNNAQRHDMANDVLLELYDMCDQVINVCPARKMGSLKDLI